MKLRDAVHITPVLLVLILVLVSACSPSPTETSAPEPEATDVAEVVQPTEEEIAPEAPAGEEEPVVLRVGGLVDVDCWNPWTCSGMWTFGVLLGNSIAEQGPIPGCPGEPLGASSWEASNDFKTWTLHLAEGATFSDGTPANAEAAVEFFLWWQSIEDLAVIFPEIMYMEEVKAIDEWTVEYTTSVPISNSPDYDFIWLGLDNVDYWGQFDAETVWTAENYPPTSSGPYMVTDYEVGNYAIFDAWPDYHLGKPPIDRIAYQVYSNPDALVSAFIAGEIDMTGTNMPPDFYDSLINVPNAVVEEKPPGIHHFLFFNMSPDGVGHGAVKDPAVREAIDYAINKQQIIDVALLGHGILCPTGWACGPNYAGEINPDLEVYPYDPEHANQILDDAGYKDTDNDGVRETPEGLPLEFRLFYQVEVPQHATMAEFIVAWLADIGISVVTEAQERTTWEQLVAGDRDYDLAMLSETLDVDPAGMDFANSCWAADAGINALNYAGYCNAEMDELVYAYWFAEDLDTRLEPLYQAQELLHNDRPFIFLAGQNGIQAYNSEKFEFPLNSCDLGLGFWSRWSLLQAEVKLPGHRPGLLEEP